MRYGRVASPGSALSRRQRPLQLERLEHRILLAGDTYLVNFQNDEATAVTRYLEDIGQTYGARPGGLTYGWNTDHTLLARERSVNPDQRLDTLIHFASGGLWEFALPSGTYEVTASIGDPLIASTHTLNVEGLNYWDAVSLPANVFNTKTMTVSVTDGRLTIDQGAAAHMQTRINYVHIVGLPSAPNGPPAAPTITEPATNGQVVHPADVHMEAIGYSDPDGNTHKSTDWEIWTVGPGAQPVWQTLGITGSEALHTHMGDGIFINSRAGQNSLAPNTDHELKVRFRDDAGAVSAYRVRQFHTSAASVTFPLELRDVATSPVVTWQTILGSAVDLPAGASIFSPGDFIIAIDADGGSDSPGNETAPLAIDGNVGTKYLNFGFRNPTFPQQTNSELNSGFIVTPSSGASIVTSFQITTANDAVERDPTTWQLFGTNAAIASGNHSTGTAESWTLIDSGSVALPGQLPNGGGDDFRNTAGPIVNVTNNTAYASYKMLFTGVKNVTQANSMQIAEVQFFGDQVGTPPSLRLESAAGQLLLSLTGQEAAGNLVNNPAGLPDHVAVRLVIESGSKALNLGQTNLTFDNENGDPITVFLPQVDLDPNQRLDLWVAFDGATYYGTAAQTEPDFSMLARASESVLTNPFVPVQPGYVVEEVGNGYRLPVNIAFVPNPGSEPDDPLYYVTELYGSIQVVTRDGSKHEFATGLLDYNPEGPISGTGEQGLTGIAVQRDAVNPEIYHLYVGMLWDNGQPPGGLNHYPKVERIDSQPGGLAMGSRTVLLNMQPETQGQSHQISNISIGPDGKLYVHNGDGINTPQSALNLDQYRGKILRMNLDGSAPSDNPFYDASNGINARDYIFAYGFRNPFGGAWRASDGKHYEVENGPSTDRLAQVNRGESYGWNGSNATMTINAIYNWNPATAPVNIAFVQQETFGGSQFPVSKQDHAFVSESGPTYANGPQANGKRLTEFVLDSEGNRVSGPTPLVEYRGTGQGTIVGLAAGPDGLYFTELYEDSGANGATASGARIFRVRYVNPIAGDYNIDGAVDENDHAVWRTNYGSNLLLAADGNGNGIVDTADYIIWRKAFSNAQAAGSQTPASARAIPITDVPPLREPTHDSPLEKPPTHIHLALPESNMTGSRPTFRPTARPERPADARAGRDAALLTLLGREATQNTPLDLSSGPEASDSDSSVDDPLDSVDEVFAELALL